MLRLIAAVATLLPIAAGSAWGEEVVRFPALAAESGSALELRGVLFKPNRNEKLPAVVLLHSCSGIERNVRDWGEWLEANGYVALMVNSFGPRNLTNICNSPNSVINRARVHDAFAAARFLATLPNVDANRLAVMGFSHGGMAARHVTTEAVRDEIAGRAPAFRASIPFYPGGCGLRTNMDIDSRVIVPTLILHGSDDDWTPSAPCRAAVEQAKARGEPVDIIVYPNAHHGFDAVHRPVGFLANQFNPTTRRPGVHYGGNIEARDAARRDVLAFLQKTLSVRTPQRPRR
ncbi:MAG: dienelactone hydrolase family protein [Alphaproteobacteria bacterium]